MKRSAGPKRKTALAPGGPLARKGSRPGRGAPIKPVNRKRAAANRKRNFGPEADAVRAKPCLACVAVCAMTGRFTIRQSEAAHVTACGMGAAKGCCMDIVPLCSAHHEEAGEARTSQRAAFEARYGLNLRREADRIAVGHEPPLGIRGHAQRWAPACPYCRNHPGRDIRDGMVTDCPDCDGVGRVTPGMQAYADGVASGSDFTGPLIVPLADHERDALMGWVRREMEREVERRSAGQVGDDEPPFAWDREAIAHRIMQALGAPFTEDTRGEHGLAWTLCEAAGWPS